jgi:hypothetical protein
MEVMDEPPAASEQAGASRSRGWKRWLAVAGASVALVAVVATFGAIALARSGAPGVITSGAGPAGASPKDWKLYHDPLGLFSMRIPPNWRATVDMGTFSEGDNEGSMSGRSENISFRDPAQRDGVNVSVSALQITSDFGRRLYCGSFSDRGPGQALTTVSFNGYRATEMPPDGTVWLFESYNAHFQVGVEIPGVLVPANPGGPMNPPPTPTAPPQSIIHADRALLASALRSFKPTAKPLTCS